MASFVSNANCHCINDLSKFECLTIPDRDLLADPEVLGARVLTIIILIVSSRATARFLLSYFPLLILLRNDTINDPKRVHPVSRPTSCCSNEVIMKMVICKKSSNMSATPRPCFRWVVSDAVTSITYFFNPERARDSTDSDIGTYLPLVEVDIVQRLMNLSAGCLILLYYIVLFTIRKVKKSGIGDSCNVLCAHGWPRSVENG